MNIDNLITGGSKRRAKPNKARKRPRTNGNNSNTNDDELLALALGTSGVQDAHQYEESVIRNAELASTPRLMTTKANESIEFGFPSLQGLVPSRSVHADFGTIRNVLTKLRRGNNKPASRLLINDKDCLKEQMLLNLMQLASGDADMGVFPQQEAKQERKRRILYRKLGANATNPATTDNSNSQPKPRNKNSKEPSSNTENETPEGRLEGIKKGGKSVRFSSETKGSSKSLLSKKVLKLKPRRRRVGLQERRRREEGLEPDDREEDEDEISRDEIVQQLKELRMERETRRKKRMKAWNKKQNAPQDEGSSEEEFEFTGEEEENVATTNPQVPAETANASVPDAVGSTTPAPDESTSTLEAESDRNVHERDVLMCPLCGEEIPVPELQAESDIKSHRDSALAQHMSVCQTQRRSGRRRNSNVSSSTRPATLNRRERTRTVRPSYAESDEEENEFSSYEENGGDDDYNADADIKLEHDEDEVMDDDIDMDEDDQEIATGRPSKVGSRTRRPSQTKASHRVQTSSRRSKSEPLDDWYEEDYEDRVDDWIENGLERMPMMTERDVNEIPPGEEEYDGGLIVPAWINDRLFPYQRTGLQWMWELHRQQCGGMLGDEMGLGKTIQVASYLGSMAASRKVKSILIISPATMLQHWLKEMAKWAPGVRRILIHQSGDAPNFQSNILYNTMGQRKVTSRLLHDASEWLKTARRNRLFEIIDESDLDTRDPSSFCGTAYAFITTFENVRRNEEIWTNHRWSYVVIDEAQKIRNPNADVTLVCKRLKTPHRLALSGTPIQNDLRELWSIFDFVFPGRLGTLPAFETEFGVPIKRGGYSNASPMQVQLAYRCALLLKDLINPYLLRRLKKDIKEVQRMPGKKEQVLFCRLSDQQRSMYEAFLRSDYVKSVFRGSAQLLGAITVMRKICNHPDLVSDPDDDSMAPFLQNDLWYSSEMRAKEREGSKSSSSDDESAEEGEEETTEEDRLMIQRSGKMEILAKILPVWKKQGHRVLIFCQWKKMLDIIMNFVVSKGWKFGRLDGNTNVASRQRLVDTFNSDESYFGMLCTTRTGGVGLNLVGADRIILYDPDWNPQTDAQARERAWRFGQKREVTVFRMICAGTVEEKIYQRQIFKTAISNSVLQNAKQRRLFTNKDLKDLFSLKADNGSIISGSEGVTETTQLTKGNGYVDPDDEIATRSNLEDDGETMRTVLQSQGLAGIFDHDVVEGNSKDKKTSVREMEARAKQIARDALKNLQQSVKEEDQTGGSRFGGSGAQSNSLLSSIADRNAEISNATSMSSSEDMKQHTQLLKSLYRFVRSRSPTTDQILVSHAIVMLTIQDPLDHDLSFPNNTFLEIQQNEFAAQTSTVDAAVFRKLLKSIAVLQNGKWNLK